MNTQLTNRYKWFKCKYQGDDYRDDDYKTWSDYKNVN